jgi:hypothetical protein
MFKPISFAKTSSSHHSSGGLGIGVSPEPWINAHPLNRRNAAENTKPPERAVTVRPCGGETRDVRTKRPFISALSKLSSRINGEMEKNDEALLHPASYQQSPLGPNWCEARTTGIEEVCLLTERTKGQAGAAIVKLLHLGNS